MTGFLLGDLPILSLICKYYPLNRQESRMEPLIFSRWKCCSVAIMTPSIFPAGEILLLLFILNMSFLLFLYLFHYRFQILIVEVDLGCSCCHLGLLAIDPSKG